MGLEIWQATRHSMSMMRCYEMMIQDSQRTRVKSSAPTSKTINETYAKITLSSHVTSKLRNLVLPILL